MKVCLTCQQPFDKRGIKYCSKECYSAAPKAPRSAEHAANQSAVMRGRPKPWLRGERNPNWGNKARGGRRARLADPRWNIVRTSYVYTITNRQTGAIYIGWTTNVNRRWMRHHYRATSGRGGWLYSAMRKYGSDSFAFDILETWSTEAEAREAEVWVIAYLKSIGAHLYNMTVGGEGTLGRVHSQETRRKMSELAKKRPPISEVTRHKLSEAAKRQVHSDERRRKTSEKQIGRPSALKGRSLSSEHREKQRIAALKRWERTRERAL